MSAASAAGFVGRQRELTILTGKLDDALAGAGSLVMLAGEPGIGKTRTAREFAKVARSRGAIVLWGQCFEGDWSPPYGPWSEALGEYARSVEPGRLRLDLGPGALPLAQLVPAVRSALPDTPLAAPLSPEAERFRLHDAVAQFLRNTAKEKPIVLLLDDLHWADRDSLRLLLHVARFVGRARLLLVGTYRDPDQELDRGRPLTDTLAILRRETDDERILLRGLSYGEIDAYLAQAADRDLPEALVRGIYEATDGNPFYTREVFRHLVEEGKIVRRAEGWSTDFSIGDLGIPPGVRQVLGRRLSRLSTETMSFLQFAAVFTGGFDAEVLKELTQLPENVLLDCIDEALRVGLIRAIGDTATYDFSHAIVRHTLYDEFNPDRKAHLHRRVASALEHVYAGRDLDHAAELAAQYRAFATLPESKKGIRYCLAAAEQARAGYAQERTVAFLRMARDLAQTWAPEMCAGILCRLAVAEAESLMLDDAQQTVARAMTELAQRETEPGIRAEFLAAAARALKDGGADGTAWESLVDQGLALVADRRDLTWARLTLLLGREEIISSGPLQVAQWLGYDPRAVAVARAQGDESDYARTLEPFDWRSVAETTATLKLARTWTRPMAIIRGLDVVARDLIYHHGALHEAVECLQELLAAGERYGSIPTQAEALVQLALCQSILGDLSLAQQTARRAKDMVARLGAGHRLRLVAQTAVASVLSYFLEGDWPALARWASRAAADPSTSRTTAGLTTVSFAAYNMHRAGHAAESRRLLAALTPLFERAGRTSYLYNGSLDRAAAAVWELGAVEFADSYRRLALDLLSLGEEGSPFRSNALIVARMAVLLGDLSQADEYFDRARLVLETSGQRSIRAIVDYDEALALIRGASANEIRITELLERAEAQCLALGMNGWAERARAQRNGRAPPPSPRLVDDQLPDGLTAREIEVLRLLASGMTNKEIAARLIVSIPTVQRHVANIYGKIGAHGRADAATYALRHGLLPMGA